jgi:hypothetical protein
METGAMTASCERSEQQIRETLLACWGRQACQRQDEWPAVLKRLFTKIGNGQEGSRGSYRPAVDEAVVALGRAFADGVTIDADVVWRAFSKLDPAHCEELARELMELAQCRA